MNRKKNGLNRKYNAEFESSFDNLKYSPRNILDAFSNMHH
ncbi:MAG: hypothetical protein BAJALOKI2v1_420001 [Promethearchaeota archaeon]|nr:MAG: hypothetical protein BAJALOKI2v1_420001 [Candidatus Lokiarchaeota archaeon]